MPGTAEDPVKLGPFKRLKEVHWPAHIVFRVRVHADKGDTSGSPCTPSLGSRPAGYTAGYSVETYVTHTGVLPNAAWIRANSGWTPISIDTLTGFPALSTVTLQSHGVFEVILSVAPWQVAVQAGGITPPLLPLPSEAGAGNFMNGINIAVAIKGHSFTGGIACYVDPDGFPPALESAAMGPVGTLRTEPIDLSNVVATYENKAYRPVATRMVDLPGASATGRIDVYVLCKRSPADDPTPP